jgi:hypothetical protein
MLGVVLLFSVLPTVLPLTCSMLFECCNSQQGYCYLGSRVSCCQCAPGSYANGCCRQGCTLCDAGTFSTSVGAAAKSSCQSCAPGSFGSSQGQTSCQPCPPGLFNPVQGQTACRPCPGGSFSSSPGASASCSSCPAGSYCPPGCSLPLTCPPGSECRPNSALPQPCANGTFADAWGKELCTSCPPGSFCPFSNMTSPIQCQAGFSCPQFGMAYQIRCDPGTFCPAGSSMPQLCPAGSFNPSSGASSCTPCAPGSFNPKNGSSSPADCGPCPPGSYNPIPGGSLSSACLPCPTGALCPLSGMSLYTACVSGSYCPASGMSAPIVCPPGSYCPFNSTHPSLSPPGSLCPYSNMTKALPCPSGFFCAGSGSSVGAVCRKGHYCPAASPQQCRCQVLTFQDEDGASSCKKCAKQAVPSTAQVACVTKIAQSASEKAMYTAIVVIFSIVAFASCCMLAALVRSRGEISVRPFHSGVCLYMACFVIYGILKALAVRGLLTEQSRQEQMNAEILLNCTFTIFFWLGFVGKMALIQLWMHLIHRHAGESGPAVGVGDNGLLPNARRTWHVLRVSVVVVCTLYTAGFTVLLVLYFKASALCSSQIESASTSDDCITSGDGGEPSGCLSLLDIVRDIKYFEGVLSGTVAVAFTLYALTFNGLVYAVLISAKSFSKLHHAIVSNRVLRVLLSPYVRPRA